MGLADLITLSDVQKKNHARVEPLSSASSMGIYRVQQQGVVTDGEEKEAEGRPVRVEAHMRPSVMRRFESWIAARDARLRIRRQMQAFRCEYEARAEPEVGDDGVPRCYRGGGSREDWCPPCIARNEFYSDYWVAKRIEKEHFYALCALVSRPEPALAAGAVDPHAISTGTPSTRDTSSSEF